jgi:predicted nucleotide-binding protein
MLAVTMSPLAKDPVVARRRIDVLKNFQAALTEWHDRTEQLDEENLLFAAVRGPLPPGPEIAAARVVINRNMVAARQAVVDAGVYCTVSAHVGGAVAENVDPFRNVLGETFGLALVPDVLDMIQQAIGAYEQVTSAEGSTLAAPHVNLDVDEQFVLDEVVADQFEHGEPTKLDDILLLREPDQAEVLRSAVASLKAKGCLERHQPQAYLHLTPSGLLASRQGPDVAALADRLLAYLLKRHRSDRSRFTHFTWDDLKAGSVVTLDEEFPRTLSVIHVFDIYRGRAGVGPDRTVWQVPTDLVEMRTMKGVEDLRARAERIAAERRGEATPGASAQPPAVTDASVPTAPRAEDVPNLLLAYPDGLPSANLQAFADAVACSGVRLQVDRKERGPYAGVELLLPTVAFILLAKGFLEEAGKDGYQALKRGLAALWPVFFGTERLVRARAVASPPGKLADDAFSRAFSVRTIGEGRHEIKLLLRDDATLDEVDASLRAFIDLLSALDARRAPAITYQGAVALVAYDARSRTLYFPDAYASNAPRNAVTPDAKLTFNRNARNLLAMLYEAYCQAKGKDFWIVPTEETLQALGYDLSSYKHAAGRLVDRGLAKWKGQVEVTITGDGVEASEDDARLDARLPIVDTKGETMSTVPDKKKVFIIHGRNHAVLKEVGIFLRSMGLDPRLFRDVRKGMGGATHVSKVVERGMEEAQGVLALITPDEFASLRTDLRKERESGQVVERWQARPNVIFEAGMAFGRHPDRVAFAVFGDAKLFTDVDGIHLFRLTNEHGPDSSRAQLRGVLEDGMKCDVNLRSDEWMTAGDFDAVTKGLSDSLPANPLPPALTPAVPPTPLVVKDDEALALIKSWLRTRGATDERLTYADVNKHLGVTVPAEVLRRLLPEAARGTSYTVEAFESWVVVTFHRPGINVRVDHG